MSGFFLPISTLGHFYHSDPLLLHLLVFPPPKKEVFVPGACYIDSSSELLTTEGRLEAKGDHS
jgi:hypothetical protein